MKKVIIAVCTLGLLMLSANSLDATTHNFSDWQTADGYYGSKEEVSDIVTKMTGKDHTNDQEPGFPGQVVGPYSKASKGMLSSGITEEVYVELDFTNIKESELFEATVSLNQTKDAAAELTENVVMTQRSSNQFVVTANWAPSTIATLTEEGLYTYRWHYFIKKDGKAYVNFQILLGDEVKGTSGDVVINEINVATMPDVNVRSVWFCNIKVENGILVHSRLPKVNVEVETEATNENVTVEDESFTDVLEEALQEALDTIPELKELAETNDVTISLTTEPLENLDEETTQKFESVIENSKIANYFDISVVVKTAEETHKIHELNKEIKLSVLIPELPSVEKGYERTYYILREHNGKVEKLPTSVSEDGKSLLFSSKDFSNYAIAYADTLTTNPQTGDSIITYVIVAITSLVGLVGISLYFKKNA